MRASPPNYYAWGFSPEARRGSPGASRAAPGKSGLHARGEGERVLALESREGSDIKIYAFCYGDYICGGVDSVELIFGASGNFNVVVDECSLCGIG